MFEDRDKTEKFFSLCEYFLFVELYDYLMLTSSDDEFIEFEDLASRIDEQGGFEYGGVIFYANIKEDFTKIPPEANQDEKYLYIYQVAIATVVKDVWVKDEFKDQLISIDDISAFDNFMHHVDLNDVPKWIEEQTFTEQYTVVTPNNFIAHINLN